MKYLKMSIMLLLTVAVLISCEKETIIEEDFVIKEQLSSRLYLEEDADQDGCADSQDSHPNSNMSETIIIGGYDSGVTNEFVDCGITMMDQIEDVIRAVSLEYENENWDELHRDFTRGIAKTTYYWRKDRLITRSERSAISRTAWQSKSNFSELVIELGDPLTLLAGGITIQTLLNAGHSLLDLLTAGVSVSDLLAAGFVDSDFIGELYQGGIIFYLAPSPTDIDGDGDLDTGLLCAIEYQNEGEGIQWYNGYYTTTGATGTAIGTGLANTEAIIISQGETATNYAAGLARAYKGGGYDDWYLPSKDELNAMYLNRAAINYTAAANGGESFISIYGRYHWSSTEINYFSTYNQEFNDGYYNGRRSRIKRNKNLVRAVRTF